MNIFSDETQINNNITYVSLGCYCLTSMLLKENGLKFNSFPFDWMVISVQTIIDILNDDFNHFMCKSNFTIIDNTTLNKNYIQNDIKLIPNLISQHQHHNLLNDKDYEYYKRCIQRFKCLNNPIFIIIEPLYLTNSNSNIDKYLELNSILSNLFKYHKLIIFTILKLKNDTYKEKIFNNLKIIELETEMSVGRYNMMYPDQKGIDKIIEIITNLKD